MESLQNFSKELQKYIFKRSQSEAASVKLYKDVSVANFSYDDVNKFSYETYHATAMDRYPILMASVTGAVCNQSYEDMNNPTRKGFGGSRSSEDISLKPVVCQTISRMLHNKLSTVYEFSSEYGSPPSRENSCLFECPWR